MSARLASAMTSSPASRASTSSHSSAARPVDPQRSKKATWGLTTGTTPAKASMHRIPKWRSPLASSVNPHCPRSSLDGSMPAQRGPVVATAAATREPNPPTGPGSPTAGPPQFTGRPDPPSGAPRLELAEDRDRGLRITEGGSAHLDGVGPGHQQLHRILSGHHAAHPDDRRLRMGRPDVVDGAHRHRMDGRARQPAPARSRTEDGPPRLDIDGHGQH